MYIPAARMIDVLGKEFSKVAAMLPEGPSEASSAQAIEMVLRLLKQRQQDGMAAVRNQFEQLFRVLDRVSLPSSSNQNRLDALRARVDDCAGLEPLEALWIEVLGCLEDIVAEINSQTTLSKEEKNRLCQSLVQFESSDLLRQIGDEASETSAADTRITHAKLQDYLRDRFDEPMLKLTSMQPLAGGFGKETILFAVDGHALTGEFVMRRDIGDNSGLENDCHKVDIEYRVIRAAYEKGFPAPEAIWLDTEHALLPGSDFIIMRRSPGVAGGSFFGASNAISEDLSDVLADIAARLHALPPVTELGDLNESICGRVWSMSRAEAIRSYIQGWYDFWRSESHNPSPAIVSLYGWLLTNVPDRHGAPSLLHGDFGFHNFLMEDGQIQAVVDWEFAHVGDPAEDLGYIKVTVGQSLDWDKFMSAYLAAGGEPIDDMTLNFFQVWAYVRNASAANLIANLFVEGIADDLKLSILSYIHIPHFINQAWNIIAQRDL